MTDLGILLSKTVAVFDWAKEEGIQVIPDETNPTLRLDLLDYFKYDEGALRGALAEHSLYIVAVRAKEDLKEGYLIITVQNSLDSETDGKITLVIYSSEILFEEIAETLKPENFRILKREYYKLRVLAFFIRLKTWLLRLLTGKW